MSVGLSRHFTIYLIYNIYRYNKENAPKREKERKTDKKKEKREKINYVYIVSPCQAFVNRKTEIFKKSSYFKVCENTLCEFFVK